jgi:hypothetical protein
MTNDITFNRVAIINTESDFVSGDEVLALLNAGVTEFVEGIEDIDEDAGPVRPAPAPAPADVSETNNGYFFGVDARGEIVKR